MNNSSLSDDLTLGEDEIDDLWNSINSSPLDSFHYWISLASFVFALLGSLSNLMSVIVLLKLSTQLSTFVYLTSLSISDMITCLTIMIMQILDFSCTNSTKYFDNEITSSNRDYFWSFRCC